MATEMGIFETMYNCRAMRRLKPDPVPEPLLVKLIDAANQAPTGSNQQGARWIVVRDAEQRSKLAALNKVAATRYIRLRTEEEPPDEKRERLLAAVRWQVEHMQDIPALVIACYRFGESVVDNPQVGARGGGSIWPAVQNLLLAARALGIGGTITTLHAVVDERAKELLGIPEEAQIVYAVPLGYPKGAFGPVTRKPLAEVASVDRWGDSIG